MARWLSLLMALGLAVGVTSLAVAASTEGWLPGRNLSSLPGRSFQATLARNPASGELFAVWTEEGIAEWEEIVARRWEPATQRWLPLENLSQSEPWERDGSPILVFDAQGQGLLVWTRTYAASEGAPADGHDVLWRSWDGRAWSPESILMHGDSYLPGSPGGFTLVPVNTPDAIRLFIVWGTGYRMTEYRDGTWSALSPWDYESLDVMLAAAILDDAGVLHAAAFGANSMQWGWNYAFHDAYYLTHDGTGWSKALNLSSTDGVAASVGLAVDGQGRLHFLWSDPDSPFSDESLSSNIWERVYKGGIWTANTQVLADKPDRAVSSFSVTTDGAATLHLAWSEGVIVHGTHADLDIHYRSGDGQIWGAEEKVTISTVDSRYPVVVAGDEDVAVLWQEVFAAGGNLPEHEVFVSLRASIPADVQWSYLPLADKRSSTMR